MFIQRSLIPQSRSSPHFATPGSAGILAGVRVDSADKERTPALPGTLRNCWQSRDGYGDWALVLADKMLRRRRNI
jgi:hypothetical protein